jgi:four helix bundle protein
VFRTLPLLPKGYSALADQWKRASISIPLNIAEAVGKVTAADRANRYAIARGEVMECGAIIDVVRFLAVAPE